MTKNDAQSMRKRNNSATTRGGKIDINFLLISHINIQTFKDGIFYRNKNIRLKTVNEYYKYIRRIFNIIGNDRSYIIEFYKRFLLALSCPQHSIYMGESVCPI